MINWRASKTSMIWFAIAALVAFVVLHLIGLTNLPIFADEAIYIRWAQLIIDDPSQYLFFSLNDGKTPLFIWQLVPLLHLELDPLFAGRLLSVIAGLAQVILLGLVAKQLRFGKLGIATVFVFVTLAPFWFFHHRMALMDAWLTVWITASLLALLKLYDQGKWWQPTSYRAALRLLPTLFANKTIVLWFSVTALSFALALLTKIPAVLAFLPLTLSPWLVFKNTRMSVVWAVISMVSLGIGILLTGLLLLHPAGPQLFTRSGDFLLPISEVLSGRWRETVPSFDTYIGYFYSYMSLGVLFLAVIPLFFVKTRRQGAILLVQFFFFFAPIWILGRMVYPRYLFPSALWLTLAAALGLVSLINWSRLAKQASTRTYLALLVVTCCVVVLCLRSLQFLLPAWTNSNVTPFVSPDKSQYLATWSSGHGIIETYDLMRQWSETHPEDELLVATEGRFGTLPDALLLYNFAKPLPRVRIEGTGETGIGRLSPEITALASASATRWLVVNSDRLNWNLPPEKRLGEFCRPIGSVCLQVWDVTEASR